MFDFLNISCIHVHKKKLCWSCDADVIDPNRTKADVETVAEEEAMTVGTADTSPSEEIEMDPARPVRPTRVTIRPAKYRGFETQFRPTYIK